MRIDFEIRKKEKHIKTKEFVKEMKEIHEEVKVMLVKLQKEINIYMNRNRKEMVKYKVVDKMLSSMKDLT